MTRVLLPGSNCISSFDFTSIRMDWKPYRTCDYRYGIRTSKLTTTQAYTRWKPSHCTIF